MPWVFAALIEKAALLPTGSAVRSVVSELTASPSGSATSTVSVSCWPSFTETVAAALTAGARSTFVTEMLVVADAVSAFCAVNVTG